MSYSNFQLYRTTPRLSGNLMIDLIVDDVDTAGTVKVNNIQLKPISKNIYFPDGGLADVLQQTHQENIRRFYKTTQDKFYDDAVDYTLNSDWFIMAQSSDVVKNWDDTYWAGTSRTPMYIYGTQYRCLVPLWLEHVTGDIVFKITIKSGDTPIKILSVELSDEIKKYLDNYFEYIGLHTGNDRVVNINIKNRMASLSGIDVTSGNYITTTADILTDNFLYRERPVMEADNLITSSFKENLLIVPQLINFGVCFNVDNFLTPTDKLMYSTDDLIVSVDTEIDGELLEKRDLFTNYQYIATPTSQINKNGELITPNQATSNVLEYLSDYKSIPLIHKNKVTQTRTHWSLAENENYLFNLYNGFGSVIMTEDGASKIYHYYGFPDSPRYDFGYKFTDVGTVCEIPFEDLEKIASDDDFISTFNKYGELLESTTTHIGRFKVQNTDSEETHINIHVAYTAFDIYDQDYNPMTTNWANANIVINRAWVLDKNGAVEYDTGNNTPDLQTSVPGVWMFCANSGNDVYILFWSKYSTGSGFLKGIHYEPFNPWFNLYDLCKLCNKATESLTGNTKSAVEQLIDYYNSVSFGNCIVFNNTILPDNPLAYTDIEEVDYFKAKSKSTRYLYRLDGKVKPTMLRPDSTHKNYMWFKRVVTDKDLNNNDFMQYAAKGIIPNYTSVKYDSMVMLDSNGEPSDVPVLLNYNEVHPQVLGYLDEYKWFDKSAIHQLPISVQYFIGSDVNDADVVRTELYEAFADDFSDDNENITKYRFSLYNVEYEFLNYKNNKYNYKVNLTLK